MIAPPGALAVHGYSTTDAYLLKIVADALAITNNRPDLVLLNIGVNDIGRGRNPYQVATNDMPALLDLIFTKAPGANIILSKVTSIQTGAFSYNTYAANVLIYNAALQAMVNQRHSAGQNVFLADMYSAVDYNTMFQVDHVHPNALGLASMAGEWLARIQTITRRTDRATRLLIRGGAAWEFNDQGQDLGINWAQTDYDDSGWSNGQARLGYGDAAAATILSYGSDPANRYPATYFRRWFEVPLGMSVTNLNFRLSRASGAVVWLNGEELFRANMPAGAIAYTNFALGALNPYMAHVYHQTNLPVAGLLNGTNLVAVELHQSSPSFFLHCFDMELLASGYLPPTLSIARSGDSVLVSWPLTNAADYKLYSTTNLDPGGTWTLAMAMAQTNGGTVTVTQTPAAMTKFFRLQKP